MMDVAFTYTPLLPWAVIWALGFASLMLVAYAAWARLAGWALRGLSLLVLAIAIANPSLQEEDREPLSDIVIAVVDETASQKLKDRDSQTSRALDALRAEIEARQNTELRVARLGDGSPDCNCGTALMSALGDALADVPEARHAGSVLITDGNLHDLERAPGQSAPLHVLLTGRPDDWDRRLTVKNAPGFAIIGESVELTLRIDDQGRVPASAGTTAMVEVSVDGLLAARAEVPVGEDLKIPVTLDHAGNNIIRFEVAPADGELTDRNNAAIVQMNGIRDRLRVLLVSGEPHAGERTWRNLLKSDSAVDLVHFTILRPLEKQDGVPVSELSLIAFPTRELFLDKIDEFDLIIFDRYKRRGILPSSYLRNVADYVRRGGAVLIAAGPDFAAADSLYRSPLESVIPVVPTARIIEEGFRPAVTEIGQRHPVTRGLDAFAPADGWGRWFRLIEVTQTSGHSVMSGVGDRPLLVLDRVDEGRFAMLASDHAWLWGREVEGGGPQLELLRRLAHWMMKEPDLEEEVLLAQARGQEVTITRRTMGESSAPVTVTSPDGDTFEITLDEKFPGVFEGTFTAEDIGLFKMASQDLDGVFAVGPAAPREFEDTIATGDLLADLVAGSEGGILRLSDGMPDVRDVRVGRPAAGRNWIGITPRNAYTVNDIQTAPILPAWAMLLLAALLAVAGWMIEGRRSIKT